MHDVTWRETMERHHTALVEDIAACVQAEVESNVTAAVAAERVRVADDTRRRLSESLNQTVRRIRQTSAEHETLQLLLEDSASCAARAVVVLIENHQASIAAWRGASLREQSVASDDEKIDTDLTFQLADAAAIASCVETRDPMVALAVAAEISRVVATALSPSGMDKVYLFPITVRQNTVAVLMACDVAASAPIELLCEAAGMKMESFIVPAVSPAVAQPVGADLVQIAGGAGEPTSSSLSPEEQAIHLRAQRAARVRVAQMRISESAALRKGVQASDIYGALRPSIDSARDEYRRTYISQSPSMVDYLHVEIVRSLAHGDSRLMGHDYAGPIVASGTKPATIQRVN